VKSLCRVVYVICIGCFAHGSPYFAVVNLFVLSLWWYSMTLL
jgi:hypothetical protein